MDTAFSLQDAGHNRGGHSHAGYAGDPGHVSFVNRDSCPICLGQGARNEAFIFWK